MKTLLNVDTYGVSEMKRQEMVETSGGELITIIALVTWGVCAAVAAIMGVSAHKAEAKPSTNSSSGGELRENLDVDYYL